MITESELYERWLARSAVRRYYNNFTFMPRHPRLLSTGHYHAVWQKGDKVYLHINSVVTFCHMYNPDEFCHLTAHVMRKVFPKFEKISYEGQCFSYRVITLKEWESLLNEHRD